MGRNNNLRNFVFSDNDVDVNTKNNPTLPLSLIVRNSTQPRRYFDRERLQELCESIKKYGVLEPLIVRPLKDGQNYELVVGERRLIAASMAQCLDVPVVIRSLTDTEAKSIALIENLQREDLNPIEETEGILELLAIKENLTSTEVISQLYRMYNEVKGNVETVNPNVRVSQFEKSVKEIFGHLGSMNWESFVKNKLPLLKLPKNILDLLRAGQIEYTKARAISSIKDEIVRSEILNNAISNSLSLSEIKKQINSYKNNLAKDTITESPKARLKEVTQKIAKSKAWNNPKKWKKVERLLKQLENLVEME